MNDDLAVPQGLAFISEAMKAGNNAITTNDKDAIAKQAAAIRGALSILGCDPFDPVFASTAVADLEVVSGLVELAIEQRNAARARKDFAASDLIRDCLTKIGITIEDTPNGTRWNI
jgi:cysteinyl-tRNA synthetase